MQKLKLAYLNALIRLDQTFYALTFVLTSSLLAFIDRTLFLKEGAWKSWLFILPSFFAARISGMAFNQWIDSDIDAKNPRTENRMIPSGKVTKRQAATIAILSLCLFLYFCSQINRLCLILAPIVACLLVLYSYMKRIHASCHFVLAFLHFLAPIMAWIAIYGSVTPTPIFLGLTAFFSIAGSEIIYSLQDYQFDLQHNLHSIPVKMGEKRAVLLAKVLHVLSLCTLVLTGLSLILPWVFYFGPLCLGCCYLYFYVKLQDTRKQQESHIYFVSAAPGFVTLVFTCLGVLWRALSWG